MRIELLVRIFFTILILFVKLSKILIIEIASLKAQLDNQKKDFEQRNKLITDRNKEFKRQIDQLEKDKENVENLWREMEKTFKTNMKQLREEKYAAQVEFNKNLDSLKNEVSNENLIFNRSLLKKVVSKA